ncbi:MAG: hypothetical protein ACJAWV_003507 [Flammeovirgaceae bacterium]|jgi:hypothetical protein
MNTKTLFLFLLPILFLASCRDYNSEEYIKIENQAINDIIPEIIDLEDMIEMNDYKTDNIILFLASNLDTFHVPLHKPIDSRFEIEKALGLTQNNKEELEILIEKYEKQKALFAPIVDGTLKPRKLKHDFKVKGLKVELVETKMEELSSNIKGEMLGVLEVSRVLFKDDFNEGFLSYLFYCGDNCYWRYNIEIGKSDGKWRVVKEYSGIRVNKRLRVKEE